MCEENYFKSLYEINVWDDVEEKNGFDYLPWHKAVKHLKLQEPTATWGVIKQDNGLPYIKTEVGYFVEVWVDVKGIRIIEIFPVLDQKNNTITPDCINPISNRKKSENNVYKADGTPFMGALADDINTAIKRALVKCVAQHGLGLDMYTQENKPFEKEKDAAKRRLFPIDELKISKINQYLNSKKGEEVKSILEISLERLNKNNIKNLNQEEATKLIDVFERKFGNIDSLQN